MVGVPANYKTSTLYTHEQRRFRYADVDKDHKLTVKEFVYFLNPDEGKHMLDAIVKVRKEIIPFVQQLLPTSNRAETEKHV